MQPEEIERELGGEWLLPAGNGGYGSGRCSGIRSRSYHGLLVAALPAPQDRVLVLAQVNESVIDEIGRVWLLDSQLYRDGTIHADGRGHLAHAAREDDGMVWRWRCGEILLERRLELGPGNRGRLVWTVLEGSIHVLRCRPFPSFRSHHGGEGPATTLAISGRELTVAFEGHEERLRLEASQGQWREAAVRHVDILLADEEARGLQATETLDSPVELTWADPEEGDRLVMDFALEDGLATPPRFRSSWQGTGIEAQLGRAMIDFLIVAPSGRPGLLAGYPWFNEWGRDSMIALPGLALALGGDGVALEILEAWAERERGGLLPNRLAEDEGEALYNSADAPLWYLRAFFRVWRGRGGGGSLPARCRQAAVAILEAFHDGAEGGIQVDPEDGLLLAGDAETQLTWMDARFENEAITPRYGKCVELQALYHEALLEAAELGLHRRCDSLWRDRADRLAGSFRRRFLDGPGGGLEDCVDGDRSLLRPNQLIALGSRHPIVGRVRGARALAAIEPLLLTPRGPRSLAPDEPGYQGRYRGGPEARDRAYHQGCVWGWLIGPWGDALMALADDPDAGRLKLETRLAGLLQDLDSGVKGQIGEIFDGEPPHLAVGAPAQAWSVAESLRLIADHRLDLSRIETILALLGRS